MKPAVGAITFLLPLSAGKLSVAPADSPSADGYALKQENICGQYCLTAILRYLGRNVRLAELLPAAPVEHGSDLARLKLIAEAYDLKTLGAHVSEDTLFSMRRPAILHVNGNHFIALLPGKAGTGFVAIDPPQSFAISRPEQLTARWKWKGNCLFIDEREIILPPSRPSLIARIRPFGMGALALVFAIALICRLRPTVGKPPAGVSLFLIIVPAAALVPLVPPTAAAQDSSKPHATGTPRASVDNPIFDAGIVFEDTTTITHTFTLKNTGAADLVIKDIKTDCSCTSVANDKKTVAPGLSVPLKINFHVKGRFGKLAERKTAVTTNDPRNPLTVLTIRAERRREFTLDPPAALLGLVPMATEKILLVRVTPGAADKKLDIGKADTSSPFLEVSSIEPNIPARKNTTHYLLKLHLSPKAPAGFFEQTVRIPCLGTARKTLEIPVRAEIQGPIRMSLFAVQFGIVTDRAKQRTKSIHLASDKPFDILNVTCDRPWLKVLQEETDERSSYLKVTITPSDAPKGSLKATLTVQTSMPEMSTIRIPVFAFKHSPLPQSPEQRLPRVPPDSKTDCSEG